jgi:hypothetical protein
MPHTLGERGDCGIGTIFQISRKFRADSVANREGISILNLRALTMR